MQLLKSFGLALAALSIVYAAPSIPKPKHQEDLYYLRVNAPKQPWHERHIVQLPSTQILGLENFTVHPTTPPVTFAVLPLGHHRYALRAKSENSDETTYATPASYIAALRDEDQTGPRTASMQLLSLSDPHEDDGEACPEGQICAADDWVATTRAGQGLEMKGLTFPRWKGQWRAVKDQGSEGWGVYFVAETREGQMPGHEITLDVVRVA